MIIQDNFLQDYDGFRSYCDRLSYTGITSPVDQVYYPGVCLDIPENIQAEVRRKIERLVGHDITINFIFLRLMLEGDEQPHQVHTDTTMGEKSFMLYLSRSDNVRAGTALVKHITGFEQDPLTPEQQAIWAEDHAILERWNITEHCNMTPNRACVFDARKLHRAEPVEGFGSTPEDGRLVLTVFFDENKTDH